MKPEKLPKKLIRVDDGEEFLLNEEHQLYYLWFSGCENHISFLYTWETLMEGKNKGKFAVATGEEDLLAMKKKWFDSVKKSSDGHGGCKGFGPEADPDRDYEGENRFGPD